MTTFPLRVGPARAAAAAALCAMVLMATSCSSGSSTPNSGAAARPSTSVPVSAAVTAPTGPAQRTPPATQLKFGASAFLPADAFRPGGQLAMFTVTGIEPGVSGELPESLTHGGVPFYVHVTITSLSARQIDVPSTVGLAGSVDGRTATLTAQPPANFGKCVANAAPKDLARGSSFATCFVALADPDTDLTRVIYWAQTTNESDLDYKTAPVVWSDGTPAPTASSSAPATTG